MQSRNRCAFSKDISLALRHHVQLRLHISEVGPHSEVRTADRHHGVVSLLPEEPQTLRMIRPVLVEILRATSQTPPTPTIARPRASPCSDGRDRTAAVHYSTHEVPRYCTVRESPTRSSGRGRNCWLAVPQRGS